MSKQNYLSGTDWQIINLIQSFPIPNTKEDIMEFAVLAISNVEPDAFSTQYNSVPKKAMSNAWMSKFEQAYQKGKLMFGNSPELENIYSLYVTKKKTIKWNKNRPWIFVGIGCGVYVLLAILSAFVLILTL